MRRREVLLGAAAVLSGGAAYALQPREQRSLMPADCTLDAMIPTSFGTWISRHAENLVAPEEPNSLAAELYGQTLGRIYQDQASGAEVMMLLAYGDSQTDKLQLHRPESCYPAFGFQLSESRAIDLRMAPNVEIPGRRLLATAAERVEAIVYWSRLGEFFPVSGGEQRIDRLKTSMAGYVADGLLARFSGLGDTPETWAMLSSFVPRLVGAVAPNDRQVLVGAANAAAWR